MRSTRPPQAAWLRHGTNGYEVELVDVAPTLLDLVGAPIPAAMRGRSLLPRIEGKALPPPHDPVLTDLVLNQEPARRFAAEEIRAGRWPMWAASAARSMR